MGYIAVIHKDPDSDYGVSFPDFPGCVSAGRSLDEAQRMAAEALAIALEETAADRQKPPEPSSRDVIMGNPDFRDGIAFLEINPAPSVDRTVRVNISIGIGELQTIDAARRARSLSRSAFLVRAALGELHTITDAKADHDGRMWIAFDDDPDAVVVDLSPMLAQGGIFAPLREFKHFSAVELGPGGRSMLWRIPGEGGEEVVDLCADALWLMAHPEGAAGRRTLHRDRRRR